VALTEAEVAPRESPRAIVVNRAGTDNVYRSVARGAGIATMALITLIGVFLLVRGWDALAEAGLSFFTTQAWRTSGENREFGIAALVYGTLVIAVVALVIAVPVGIAAALFINEYAPLRSRRLIISLVDLLAAVPSLIYGFWGREYLQAPLSDFASWVSRTFGFIPIFDAPEGARFQNSPFIAGVVVSLMTLPITTSVIREVFAQTPPYEKEGALALGATRWGMIRTVVLPFGRGGIIGGSMLGLGRALGETIAVALIISPTFKIDSQILKQGGNSVASHIALSFGEADEFGLSALIAAGLALFVLTLIVNMIASFVVSRSRSGTGVEI